MRIPYALKRHVSFSAGISRLLVRIRLWQVTVRFIQLLYHRQGYSIPSNQRLTGGNPMAVFNHIRQALWALAVLWKFKTIRRIDRLRLWMKTVRLYASLLAFTDAWRPKQQLGNAAICSLITALYDYETDWVPISNKKDSITVRIIHQYVGHGYASAIAEKLFQEDLGDQLTADGLERGSVAFALYRSVIGSTWLKAYSVQDVAALGRLLQI